MIGRMIGRTALITIGLHMLLILFGMLVLACEMIRQLTCLLRHEPGACLGAGRLSRHLLMRFDVGIFGPGDLC